MDEALYYLSRIATDTGQSVLAKGYEADLLEHFSESEYIDQLEAAAADLHYKINYVKAPKTDPKEDLLPKSGPTELRGS